MESIAAKRVLFVKEGRDNYGAERATLRLFNCLDRNIIEPALLLLEYSREPSPFLSAACDLDLAVFATYSPKELGQKLVELSSEYDAIVSIGYKCHILCWWYGRHVSIERYAICHGWVATDVKLKLYNWLAKWCLKRFDGVMTVSPTIDVSNDNYAVVYNGIDVETQRKAAEEPLDNLGQLPEKPFIIYVGRLEREKGVLELARAFDKPVEGAGLVIVGTGTLEDDVRRFAESNESPITFLGYQENPAPLIRRAACLILPSETEALPLVMLEAMALKTPVLSTPVGAVPDVISDGKTGYLLPSNSVEDIKQGVTRVLCDSEEAGKIADQGYNVVADRFSDQAVAERVCRFLNPTNEPPA